MAEPCGSSNGGPRIACSRCGAEYDRLPGIRCPRCGNPLAGCESCRGCGQARPPEASPDAGLRRWWKDHRGAG